VTRWCQGIAVRRQRDTLAQAEPRALRLPRHAGPDRLGEQVQVRKEEELLERLKASAKITFMYTGCGTDSERFIREDAMNIVLSLIEAHTPKM
jgi:hypothetical protein